MRLELGDLFLPTKAKGGEGNVSEIIKKCSQRKPEGKTRSSHVGVISKGGHLLPDNIEGIRVSEMIYPEARTIDLSAYKGIEVLIYRAVGVKPFHMDVMIQDFEDRISKGMKYGWFNIILHGLDSGLNFLIEKIPGVSSDIRPFTRLFFRKNHICSSIIAKLFRTHHSITLGKPPRLIQPDDIDDHCRENDAFELIYEGIIK